MDFQNNLPTNFEIFEKVSQNPVPEFVPRQAYNLSELIRRFEHGQRLGVHCNFNPLNECQGNDETFETAPPEDVVDVVDVQRHYEQHQRQKQEFVKAKSKQAPPKEEAMQDKPEDTP